MERFLQYLFDGLSIGSVYALLALGLVIIYPRHRSPQLRPRRDGACSPRYVVYQLHEWGMPFVLSCVLGVVFGFLLGAATEVTLIRPVARSLPGRCS